MNVLVFDNYDSFTYNLVHLVEKITGQQPDVFRNDEMNLEQVAAYDKIILSPGPGIPSEAGLLLQLIKQYAASKSILGVCLGHQAIGEAFGGELVNLASVFHGVATPVRLIGRLPAAMNATIEGTVAQAPAPKVATTNLFQGLPDTIEVGRYHSWVIRPETFPEVLQITAVDDNGHIMALQHKTYDVQGVQFHPESVLTPDGEAMLRNWLTPG